MDREIEMNRFIRKGGDFLFHYSGRMVREVALFGNLERINQDCGRF